MPNLTSDSFMFMVRASLNLHVGWHLLFHNEFVYIYLQLSEDHFCSKLIQKKLSAGHFWTASPRSGGSNTKAPRAKNGPRARA